MTSLIILVLAVVLPVSGLMRIVGWMALGLSLWQASAGDLEGGLWTLVAAALAFTTVYLRRNWWLRRA